MKAYWFVSGRHYSDIYVPTAERAEGLLKRLWLTPVHTAWLIPPAAVALATWLRRPKTWLPELMLVGVPLAVVVAFWFSPRYRLPALPVIALAAAWTVRQAVRRPANRAWWLAGGVSLAVALALGPLNRAVGFDSLDPRRAYLHDMLGGVYSAGGDDEAAYREHLAAIRINPQDPHAHLHLALLLAKRGELDAALEHFHQAGLLSPTAWLAHACEAEILCQRGQIAEGIAAWRRAYRFAPAEPSVANNLAWHLATTPGLSADDRAAALRIAQQASEQTEGEATDVLDTLAAALAANGRFDEAADTLEQAIRLAAQRGNHELVAEFRTRLDLYRSGKPYLTSVGSQAP